MHALGGSVREAQRRHPLDEGFAFHYPTLPEALQAIVGAPAR